MEAKTAKTKKKMEFGKKWGKEPFMEEKGSRSIEPLGAEL